MLKNFTVPNFRMPLFQMDHSFRAKPMRLQRGRVITCKNKEFLDEFYDKIKLFWAIFFMLTRRPAPVTTIFF